VPTPPLLTARPTGDLLELQAGGPRIAANVAALEALSDAAVAHIGQAKRVIVDMAGVSQFDTLGAWLLEKMSRRLTATGLKIEFAGIATDYVGLVQEVRRVNRRSPALAPAQSPVFKKLDELGRSAMSVTGDVAVFLQMLGALFLTLLGVARRPRSLRLTSLVYQL
jgi:phospholipid/cholesterol/gamma-HCH transport system permease protein